MTPFKNTLPIAAAILAATAIASAPSAKAAPYDPTFRTTTEDYTDGYSEDGSYCREYTKTIVIDGRKENAYGTACQKPDGSWQVIDDEDQAAEEPTIVKQKTVYVQPEPDVVYVERPYYRRPVGFIGVYSGYGPRYHHGHYRRGYSHHRYH